MEIASVQCYGTGTSKPLLRRFQRRVEKWVRRHAVDEFAFEAPAAFKLEVQRYGTDRLVRCALKFARGARDGGGMLWSVASGRDLNQALTRCLEDLDASLRAAARSRSRRLAYAG